MRLLVLFILIFNTCLCFAAQKAKIAGDEVEIFSDANFDSEIIDVVREGEVYQISNKPVGPFYRIKLKSGKIGYVADHELAIPGKGAAKPKNFDDVLNEDLPDVKTENKNKISDEKEEDEEGIEEGLEAEYSGLTLQLINYHEDTMGAVQVDDLTAIGYKKIADVSWEVMAAFKTPKYYTDKINGTVSGVNLWADYGITNRIDANGFSTPRYGAGLFVHASSIKVTTAQKTYDMQDLTVGLVLEGGFLFKVKKMAVDLSVKYFFDKNSYGGFGLSTLF